MKDVTPEVIRNDLDDLDAFREEVLIALGF